MTFNLGPGQARPEQLVSAIEEENPDLIAVQELVPETVQLLRQRLSTRYASIFLDLRIATTGLLTRYSITKIEPFQPAGKGRLALSTSVNVNKQLINVLAVHPLPPDLSWYEDYSIPTGMIDKDQEEEIADIVERGKKSNPVIIIGDFNMTDQSHSYVRLSDAFKDAYREAAWGFGFTFPNHLRVQNIVLPVPFLRLDYVFYSGELQAERARVDCRGSSDHCYLFVELSKSQ